MFIYIVYMYLSIETYIYTNTCTFVEEYIAIMHFRILHLINSHENNNEKGSKYSLKCQTLLTTANYPETTNSQILSPFIIISFVHTAEQCP